MRTTPLWQRRITASAPIVPSPHPVPKHPRRTFAIWFAVVVALDLVSKAVASRLLTAWGNVPIIPGAMRLVLAHNDQSAFGISVGPYTWEINCALTLIALLLAFSLCKPLAVIDRWSPVMLGLIAGAATGNLFSLITTPRGVVDFMAIEHGGGHLLVFNFADVAAALGVVLTVRAAITVVRVILAERRVMLRQ